MRSGHFVTHAAETISFALAERPERLLIGFAFFWLARPFLEGISDRLLEFISFRNARTMFSINSQHVISLYFHFLAFFMLRNEINRQPRSFSLLSTSGEASAHREQVSVEI
jgi:hypothetical protein